MNVPPQDSDSEREGKAVKHNTRSGMLWTVGTGFLTRGIGLFTTLLLTRYMSPQQSGSVNVALILVTTVTVMTTMGLGQYVASQRQPSPRVAWNAMLLHVSLGLLAFAAALVFRQPLAHLVGDDFAARFIPLLVLTFVLERFSYVPERVLVAHMRFRQLSIMRSAGELSYCLGAILAAAFDYGPWCIVAGNLARQLVRATYTLRYLRLREWFVPEGARRDLLAPMVRFGLPLMVAAFAGMAARRWDNLLIAHYYGTAVLGLYNLAYNLAEVPAIQIAEMVADVLAPSFARMEPQERKKSAVNMVALLSLCISPLAVGLGLVAPTLARMLPPRWEGIAPYLLGLSVLSVTRPAGTVLSVYLQALRKTAPAAALQVAQVVLLLASLILCGHLFPDRPVFACYAVGLTFTLGSCLAGWMLWAIDGVPVWPLLRVQLEPVPALLLMTVAVKGLDHGLLRAGLGQKLGPWPQLALEASFGAGAYLVGALLFLPGPTHRLLNTARELLQKRRKASP